MCTDLLVRFEGFGVYCVGQFHRNVVISDGAKNFIYFPDLLLFCCVNRCIKIRDVLHVRLADYVGLAGVCKMSEFLDLERN